jgi:hypothetical protein
MARSERYRGYFTGIASQTAVPTAAHILLRTSDFTSELPSISREHPDFNLNLIFLDLHAQLQSKEEWLDVFPLLHDCRSSVHVVECLADLLLRFETQRGRRWPSFLCSSGGSAVPIIKVPDSLPIDAYFRGYEGPTRLAPFFFLDVRGHTGTIPSRVSDGVSSYSLYVVVNQREPDSYELFIRDERGCVRFRDNTIEPVAGHSEDAVVLVGYIEELSRVELFRFPSADQIPVKKPQADRFVLKYNLLNRATMELDSSEQGFESRAALRQFVEDSDHTTWGRGVRYKNDLGDPPERRLGDFSEVVTVYECFATNVLFGCDRFLDSFLRVTPVKLTFRFFAVQTLSVTASFHPDDSAKSLFRFARRLYRVLKLRSDIPLKLFETTSAVPNEIDDNDMFATVRQFDSHPILVCHDHQVPTGRRWQSIPDNIGVTDAIAVKLVWGDTALAECTMDIPVRQGMTGIDLIQAVRFSFSDVNLELAIVVVRPDARGLTRLDKQLPVDALRNKGTLRVQPIWEWSCPLVVLNTIRPFGPSGRVYDMPIDGGMVDLDANVPTSFTKRVEGFLRCAIREVGVMQNGAQKTKGIFYFPRSSESSYVYALPSSAMRSCSDKLDSC